MKKPRRRKTPETEIASKIRTAAAVYAANGQKDRAEGMIQAADMVDELTRRGGSGLVQSIVDSPDARLAQIEARLAKLEGARSKPLPPEFERKPNGVGKRSPKEIASILMTPPDLTPGEKAILAAISQQVGLTLDELIAVVNLRKTSLRTYLGNLRAAGYATVERGVNFATEEGHKYIREHQRLPIGSRLLESWLGRLPPGEEKILRCISTNGQIAVAGLIGETTGLQATSVRTYLGELSRRKLIVRPTKGRVALAPILTDEGS
jgi:DNA-binding MarR family transcriptional regulator